MQINTADEDDDDGWASGWGEGDDEGDEYEEGEEGDIDEEEEKERALLAELDTDSDAETVIIIRSRWCDSSCGDHTGYCQSELCAKDLPCPDHCPRASCSFHSVPCPFHDRLSYCPHELCGHDEPCEIHAKPSCLRTSSTSSGGDYCGHEACVKEKPCPDHCAESSCGYHEMPCPFHGISFCESELCAKELPCPDHCDKADCFHHDKPCPFHGGAVKVVFHVDTLFVEDKSAEWRANQARTKLQDAFQVERMQEQVAELRSSLHLSVTVTDILTEMSHLSEMFVMEEDIAGFPETLPSTARLDEMPLFQISFDQLSDFLPASFGDFSLTLICDYTGALADRVNAVKCVMTEGVNRCGKEYSFRSVIQAMRFRCWTQLLKNGGTPCHSSSLFQRGRDNGDNDPFSL